MKESMRDSLGRRVRNFIAYVMSLNSEGNVKVLTPEEFTETINIEDLQ